MTSNRPAPRLVATDLDGLLTGIKEGYDGRNLAGVVLVSDGIVNQGRSPVYSEFNFPIYGVAVGDTVPKKDLGLPALTFLYCHGLAVPAGTPAPADTTARHPRPCGEDPDSRCVRRVRHRRCRAYGS